MKYLARVTEERDGYDVVDMVDGENVMNTLHVRHYDGLVTWASDWANVPALEQAGQLRSVSRGSGTYGHVDVYFV